MNFYETVSPGSTTSPIATQDLPVMAGFTIPKPTCAFQVRPDPAAEFGRGLYIANQLCDKVTIDSSQVGTRIRLRMETATG